jgi:hypothetical protein
MPHSFPPTISPCLKRDKLATSEISESDGTKRDTKIFFKVKKNLKLQTQHQLQGKQ